MDVDPKDRRRHPRVALAVDVDFSSDHNFYSGRTRDLSVGGLFIETDVGVRVGTEIALELRLLERTFAVRAEVVWVLLDDDGGTLGIGVSFVDLPVETRRHIEDFMQRRPPMPFDAEPLTDAPPKGPPPLPQR